MGEVGLVAAVLVALVTLRAVYRARQMQRAHERLMALAEAEYRARENCRPHGGVTLWVDGRQHE